MENPSQPQPLADQQPLQSIVPPPISSKSKLPLLILSTFIFLILIVGVGYLLKISNLKNQISNPQLKTQNKIPTQNLSTPTPSVDQTTNWKIYTNQAGNYSLKVPSSWEIREANSESLNKNKNPTDDGGHPLNHPIPYYISSTDFYPNPNNSNTIFVGLYVYDNSEKLSINEFVNKYSIKLSNPGPDVTPFQRESFKIGAYEAIWYPLLDGGVFGRDSYLISKEDKIYEIALFTPPGQELSIKIFDQIISTFKFLPVSPTGRDQNQTTDTSNWKTYAGDKYSFKYPSEAQVSTQPVYSMLTTSQENGINIHPVYQPPYDKWYTFDLVARENPQNLDSKTIINSYIEYLKKNCSPPGCSTPIMIQNTLKQYKKGDIDGYSFHIGAETDSAMIVTTKNNKTYVFRMSGDQGNVTDYGLKLFDQILSTFKFTP